MLRWKIANEGAQHDQASDREATAQFSVDFPGGCLGLLRYERSCRGACRDLVRYLYQPWACISLYQGGDSAHRTIGISDDHKILPQHYEPVKGASSGDGATRPFLR